MSTEERFFQYFQSHDQYFWQWEDNGEVVAMPNGNTIGYRAYLLEILEVLAIQGLPPFGSVLLALIAINPNKHEMLAMARQLMDINRIDMTKKAVVNRAFNALEVIAQVPAEYHQGENRTLFFQTIFQNQHNSLSRDQAQELVAFYRTNYLQKKDFFWVKPVLGINTAFTDFSVIASLQKRFKRVEDIVEAMVNLPSLPKEALPLDELPPKYEQTENSPSLIEELSQDERTYTTGVLVKYLWGGLHIPLHQKLPSQQPLGGISDMSNKGNFDQLLPSEFAHDDLVFLSRLANNEALFFQRETPPQHEDLERIILIDNSLYNWGNIKTLAFASALSILQHPKGSLPCQVFAIGQSCQKLALNSSLEVIASLQQLSPALHAAAGLKAFFKENPKPAEQEILLISSKKALAQAAMREALGQLKSHIRYWLEPTATGEISLHELRGEGLKLLQRIQLPLEKIWKKQKPKARIQQAQLQDYPILFPAPRGAVAFIRANNRHAFKIIKRGHSILKMHRVQYDGEQKGLSGINESGWELICDRLPHVLGDFAIGQNQKQEYILLMFNPNDRKITLFNLHDRTQVTTDFKEWESSQSSRFFFAHGQFYFYLFKQYYTISLKGEVQPSDEGISEIKEMYQERKELQELWQKKLTYALIVFRNIKSAGITAEGVFVLNLHQLVISEHGIVKLDTQHETPVLQYEATKVYEGEFAFPDGSRITLHPAGMIVLQSSNQDISPVYMPSVIGKFLGMATHTHFAGNDYYYKYAKQELVLESPGPNLDGACKLLSEFLNWEPEVVYGIFTDRLPYAFHLPPDGALNLQTNLQKLGANCHLITKGAVIKRIATKQFYEAFVQPFIQHIQSSCSSN